MQKNILWGATYSEMYTFIFFTTSGVHIRKYGLFS